MNTERTRSILSGIKKFRLTEAETELIRFAEQSLNQREPVGRTAELILEWTYKQKTRFIRRSILSMMQCRPVIPPRVNCPGAFKARVV